MSRIAFITSRAVRVLKLKDSSQSLTSQSRLRLPNNDYCRTISFFSKKKFKESAEEALKKEDTGEDVMTLAEEEAQENVLTEEEIEKKRNISRLRPQHQRLMRGELPYPEPQFWTHHTVAYKRRMYAIYGEKSGINPGIMWPTRDDLADRLEYEKIAFPFTIQEMVSTAKQRRQLEKEEFERRAKEVETNMEMLDQVKAQLIGKQEAKEQELHAAQERKNKLMEEVRRHFGFTVDPKDERFQEMLQKKEKEQRKATKEARKLEKQNKHLEMIAKDIDTAKKSSKTDSNKESKKANEDADDP